MIWTARHARHLCGALSAMALTQALIAQASQEPQRLQADRIRARDMKAILDAGTSGDKTLVPALREVIRGYRYDSRYHDTPESRAHLSLARLGEVQQQQERWCGALREDQSPSLGQVSAVGGWFAIRALDEILAGAGKEAFARAARKSSPSGGYEPPAEYDAARLLTALVEAPPIPAVDLSPFPTRLKEQIPVWRAWIRDHQTELRKLEPTGKGVDFSPAACKNGRPVKQRR